MSDIASLPKVNICLMAVHYGKFKDSATRLKIQEAVAKSFPEERVKHLTRQEIVDYGKQKQIIEDGEGTKGLTQHDMMAMAAADKLFEMTVQVRAQKKGRLAKLQEELDAARPESAPNKLETDNELVDLMFNLVDYPRDRQEAYAFSRYGRTLNCVFEVFEVQENPDGTFPVDLKEAKEVSGPTEEEEVKHVAKVHQVLSELTQARQNSAKNAPVRDLAVIRVPYCDAELVELKTGDDGEAATNTLSAEQWFVQSFQRDYIETYAAYFYNFLKFKQTVEINQLMPEKQVMLELNRLKQERSRFGLWR